MVQRTCNNAALKKLVVRVVVANAVHQRREAVGWIGVAALACDSVEAMPGQVAKLGAPAWELPCMLLTPPHASFAKTKLPQNSIAESWLT